MENSNYYFIYSDQYQNLDTGKISRIILKDGTVLEVKNNRNQYKYTDKSFNSNIRNRNLRFNNPENPKIKKFNSFSARVRCKSKDNSENIGFYVTPIINAPKRIIKIKVPNDEIIDLGRKNYHIENFTFQSSPKKYYCKPYKQPKRKNNIIPIYKPKNKNNNACKCPGCIYNKKD